MTCKHDISEQCCEGCPGCSRYRPECDNCGSRKDLYNTDDGIFCHDCLQHLVIDADGDIINKDLVMEFITEYSDEFEAFVDKWYESGKIVEE